jgi:hypothetical protein
MPGDISSTLHWTLWGWAILAWIFFLLIPLFPAGCASGAMILSLMAFGAGVWSFIRTRRKQCLWPTAASAPIALLSIVLIGWLLISPATILELIQEFTG